MLRGLCDCRAFRWPVFQQESSTCTMQRKSSTLAYTSKPMVTERLCLAIMQFPQFGLPQCKIDFLLLCIANATNGERKKLESFYRGNNSAAKELASFMDIINSTVGDAISDMLGVEAVLHSKGWSAQDWDNMYTDFPNRLLKVCVADRNVIKTADAERKCVAPEGLQKKIDELAASYKHGRSFVRPSGTEDIVRVYAEADTQTNADALGKAVAHAVYELCGGVGTL